MYSPVVVPQMSTGRSLPTADLSHIAPLEAATVVVATAPFGYLLGYLFTVHLVGSEPVAVWLTTVALAAVALLAVGLRS